MGMKLRKALLLVVLTALMVSGYSAAVDTPDAMAATSTPPDFKLPLRCRTTWTASTYLQYQGQVHGNAIDFNMTTQDLGQAVVAAASGKVERTTVSAGEVLIDHGGGWKTRYLHMSDIQVAAGAFVSEGQWIGRVDTIGLSTAPHLHFEVLKDGSMVLPVIDGVQVSITPTKTQAFTSLNCLPGEHGLWFANSMLKAPDGTIDLVTASGERYWVPNSAVLSCLQAQGIKVRSVDSGQFNANPRNVYGDPGGRWADCNSWTIGWMVKGSGAAVWYVASNGMRYYVPSESVVMCLGGWASVRSVTDTSLSQIPANPWGSHATCNSPLMGELVKGAGAAVYYVGPKGTRYHVQSSSVVNCLAGWAQVVDIRDSRLTAIPGNPHGLAANCNSALFDRLVTRASGQVDYVGGDHFRYWVPDGPTVACLGGYPSAIYLADTRFDAIPRNASNSWATCATKNR